MDRCGVCGRALPPGTWTCPLCGESPSAGLGEAPRAPAAPERPPLPSGNPAQLLDDAKRLGWNWGGFFLPYFWLIGHGRLTLGFLLSLSVCVPFFWIAHLVFYPAAAFYLGLNGYELAWREQPYHSIGQLHERERAWTLWGMVLSLVLLVGFILGLVYLRVLAGSLSHLFDQG